MTLQVGSFAQVPKVKTNKNKTNTSKQNKILKHTMRYTQKVASISQLWFYWLKECGSDVCVFMHVRVCGYFVRKPYDRLCETAIPEKNR